MVNYKRVSVYLPEELYQVLIAYQEQQKFEAASDAVVEIVSQFLHKDHEVKRYATVEQFKALENKVTHLNQQVAQLYQVMASSAPIAAARTDSPEGNNHTFGDTSFEEVDDEPDEILYDFLEPESPPPPSSSSK
jgi:hypothetical protein